MKYAKPPLTFEEQADQLIRRGLIADKALLIDRLNAVNYYRLSGYWYPFVRPDNTFAPDTRLDHIWRRYVFDRQLRLLVMDGIERVEVAVRTNLVYRFVHSFGPFGYEDGANLPNLTAERHAGLLDKFAIEQERCKETFVAHFKTKYGDDHKFLPLWMGAELMTFGMLFTFFLGVDASMKQAIARDYGVSDKVLRHWLHAMNGVRNICAHHGRLWNRELGVKPMIPKAQRHPDWHHPVQVDNNRVFAILTIIKYMLDRIAPQSSWPDRLGKLLTEYLDIPVTPMGFPGNWRACPIWRRA